MSEVWAALVPIGQFLGALSAIAAIATFYWSNVRLPAKRLGIVDLATKQIAFWDQALKLELSATTDSQEQEKARHRAYSAAQRIRSHANKEMERLTWSQKTNDLIFEKKTLLNLSWAPRSLNASKKFEWYLYKALLWIFFALALLLGIIFIISIIWGPHLPKNVAAQIFGVPYILATIFVSRYFGVTAGSLALPAKPQAPMLKEI